MGRSKKDEWDPRFRTLGDFIKAPSSLQEFVLFEDGHYSPARLNLGGLRKIYSNAIEDVPEHKEYLFEGKWIHEKKMGKRKTQGLKSKYISRKQIRVNPFSGLDSAVLALGDRAFNLMQLSVDLTSQRTEYMEIISVLQKEGLVTKV